MKTIGDGVMLVSPSPTRMLEAALRLGADADADE